MSRGKVQKIVPWIGTILLIPSLVVNWYLWRRPVTVSGALVTRIVDGDTFITEDKSIVRFDTLDAPELGHCGGVEAKKALEKLVLNQRVRLDSQARDINGRQVASVWRGNVWVDELLISSGWVAYASSTVDKDKTLQNLDYKNRDEKRGIYSEMCTQYENSSDPKCVIKGNIIGEWNFKGDKAYHFPGCIQYNTTRIEKWRGEEWFCTEKQAQQAGYKKSGGCGNKTWK